MQTAVCFEDSILKFFSTDQCSRDESYRNLIDQIPASKCNGLGELALDLIVYTIQTCQGYYDFHIQMN